MNTTNTINTTNPFDGKFENPLNEEDVCEFWARNHIFEQSIEQNKNKPTYDFYDGPPFATGLPHYGHILAGFIKDTVLRYQHNLGQNVPRQWGFDTHGLPIEYEIEKDLGIKTTDEVMSYGIANYNEACRGIVLKYSSEWEHIMGRLGRWADFKNDYKTMTKEFMNSVWWVWSELYKKGKVYEGTKIMAYSTSCATSLSNFETQQNYQEVNDDSLFVKFKLSNKFDDKDVYIMVWTTTPWTLPSNYTLCIGPNIKYVLVSCLLNEAITTENKIDLTTTTTPNNPTTYYILAENLIENVFGPHTNTNKYQITIIKYLNKSDLIGLEYEPLFNFVFDYINLIGAEGSTLKASDSDAFVSVDTTRKRSFGGLGIKDSEKLSDDVNHIFSHKIICGDFVTDSDGTGIVHIAPAYGADDYDVCIKNKLIDKETKIFQPLDANGYVCDQILECQGMFYKNQNNKLADKNLPDFNTWVIKQLKTKGSYYDKRQIKHNYPFCWRSDTPLIYKATNSWFVNVEEMKDQLISLNEKINWLPDYVGKNRFATWLAGSKDWGVSRSRFWGTPIPIWRNTDPSKSSDIICVSSSYELEELAGLEPNSITDLHRHFVDNIIIKRNGQTYKRDVNAGVFDCWFESGSMPYGALDGIGIVELLRNSEKGIEYELDQLGSQLGPLPFIKTFDGKIHKILPADFIAEGLDQTRGWFYTLLVLSTALFNTIPFRNVIVNGLVLAEDGKKMSKRLKNYPDPLTVVNSYGSDCLRLYILESQAVRAEPLKFSANGVKTKLKDIIIPLTNSIVFLTEYVNLYIKERKSNPINLGLIENLYMTNPLQARGWACNPINIWILFEYGKLRTQFNNFMKSYDLKSAIGLLNKVVELLNNGYIKFGRDILKGKDFEYENTNTDINNGPVNIHNNFTDLWSESLSVLYYVIRSIAIDFRAVMPFFTEIMFSKLKTLCNKNVLIDNIFHTKSIHLVDSNDYLYVNINDQNLIKLGLDFDICYNLIWQIHQLRGLNNISLKKPIKQLTIIIDEIFEQTYGSTYKNYLSFVSNECNILDLFVKTSTEIKVNKVIKPIKALFFKKYGKQITTTFDELMTKTSEELNVIISNGLYNDFAIDQSLFNIQTMILDDNSVNVQNLNMCFSEFVLNFDKTNSTICLIMDKSFDEITDRIYYYRLVATQIQKNRKLASLHPWDRIVAFYEPIADKTKYDLETEEAKLYIEKITRIKFELKLCDLHNDYFYSSKCDEIGLNIMFQKI